MQHGKYIAFLDSDDWLECDAYEKMMKKLLEENVDIVRCGFFKDVDDNCILHPYVFEQDYKICTEDEKINFIRILTSGKSDAGVCYMLIKKEIVEKTKLFPTDFSTAEDLIFEINLICVAEKIYIYNERFYHYRTNYDSTTKSSVYKSKNVRDSSRLYVSIIDVLKSYEIEYSEFVGELGNFCFYKVYIQLIDDIFFNRCMQTIEFVMNSDEFKTNIAIINVKGLSLLGKVFYYAIKNRQKYFMFLLCVILKRIHIK